MMIDVTAIIMFHREGKIATPSILSFRKMVEQARSAGLKVETIAVLDRADDETVRVLDGFRSGFDNLIVIDSGDLGVARNQGIRQASGSYISVFDGDDLWGSSWLVRAHAWSVENKDRNAILHPQLVHYFSAADYLVQSRDHVAPTNSKSFHFVHVDSCSIGFDKRAIVFNNLWTSNCFAHRDVFAAFPYKAVDPISGFGVEDWMWNAETLAAGIRHAVVSDSVHCVRIKQSNSLGGQNSRQGLLPAIHLVSKQLES
jgi:glycosyltransferase involved in cell wall biosynthesis